MRSAQCCTTSITSITTWSDLSSYVLAATAMACGSTPQGRPPTHQGFVALELWSQVSASVRCTLCGIGGSSAAPRRGQPSVLVC